MLLHLLRHAEAIPPEESPSDFDRYLTEKGRQQAVRMGQFLRGQGIRPLIISSPYLRARQTAESITEITELPAPTLDSALGCGMTPPIALKILRQHASDHSELLLVGHEPDLGVLAAHLLGLTRSDALRVRKASLLTFQIHRLAPSVSATLESFLPVKILP